MHPTLTSTTSPKSVLLELEDYSADPKSCYAVCREAEGNLSTPKDCTGTRGQWLKRQIDSILYRINSQQLPFVLKIQQTFDEVGTWVVSALDGLTDLKSRSLQPGSSQTIIPS